MQASLIGARLDRLPLSKFHRRMLLLIGAGLFLDSFEVTLMAGVLGALIQTGMSDIAMNAKFVSATFAGLSVGALFAGAIGDRLGRKASYQFNLILFGAFSILAAFAPDMWWLIAARFIMGIGLGAEYVIGYGFISEFAPPPVRGRCIAIVALGSNFAVMLSSLIGLIVIPTLGWRWMFVIAGVMAVFVWMLRKGMPESPRWLESVGRYDEADLIVRKIEEESGFADAPPVVLEEPKAEKSSIIELFQPPLVGRTLLGMFITIAALVGTYGFITWVPSFMVKQGISMVSSLWFTTLMSAGGVFGPIVGYWISDRFGRKYAIALVAAFAAIAGAIYPNLHSLVELAICGFFMVSAILLMVALTLGTYVPELFATRIRLRASGVTQFSGRVATIFSPYLIVYLFTEFGIGGVVYSLSGMYLLLCLVVLTFGIETKNRPLEQIATASN
jgi:MFS transporter, putative metabolite:H+ symporter